MSVHSPPQKQNTHARAQASISATSRAMWAMGGGAPDEIPNPIIPRVFAKTLSVGSSTVPWVSTVTCGVFSLVLCNFDFSDLVVCVVSRYAQSAAQ